MSGSNMLYGKYVRLLSLKPLSIKHIQAQVGVFSLLLFQLFFSALSSLAHIQASWPCQAFLFPMFPMKHISHRRARTLALRVFIKKNIKKKTRQRLERFKRCSRHTCLAQHSYSDRTKWCKVLYCSNRLLRVMIPNGSFENLHIFKGTRQIAARSIW